MASILSATGVVKRFGGLVAVDHVDVEIEEKSIHAIIGPKVEQIANGRPMPFLHFRQPADAVDKLAAVAAGRAPADPVPPGNGCPASGRRFPGAAAWQKRSRRSK